MSDWFDRLKTEQAELRARLDLLCVFLERPQPDYITDEDWALLVAQRDAMTAYDAILRTRIYLETMRREDKEATSDHSD